VTIAKADTGEEEQQMDIFDEQGNPLDPESLSDGDVVYGEDGSAYRYELDDEAAAEPQEQLVGKSADQDNPFRRDTPVAKSALTADLREELSKALTDRDRDEVVSKALTRLEELSKAAERAEEIAKAERTARLTR